MKKYIAPELEIEAFEVIDVVATSTPVEDPEALSDPYVSDKW